MECEDHPGRDATRECYICHKPICSESSHSPKWLAGKVMCGRCLTVVKSRVLEELEKQNPEARQDERVLFGPAVWCAKQAWGLMMLPVGALYAWRALRSGRAGHFTCRKCGEKAIVPCAELVPFVHSRWYVDEQGLVHGCLYCRVCGTIYDTVGSRWPKFLWGRMPSDVVCTYELTAIRRLIRMGDLSRFPGVPDMVFLCMGDDGRFADDSDEWRGEPTVEFLMECVKDDNPIVRREALGALALIADDETIRYILDTVPTEELVEIETDPTRRKQLRNMYKDLER